MDYHLRIYIQWILILLITLSRSMGFAQEGKVATSFDEAFKAGISSYQSKNMPDAIKQFQQALEFQPNNVSALTNLALAQFEDGHKPIAVALLRRSLAIDPDFSTPEAALKFILPQLELREIPHEIQFRETLRTQFLAPIPWPAYLLMSLLFLLAGGWLILGYLGARRRAVKGELPLPPFPSVGVLFVIVFLVSSLLSAAKFVDYQIPRGTVISDKVTVRSAPDLNSVALFDLYGGHEVIIDKLDSTSKDQWVQVTYPGALSGWIPKESIYPTSGNGLW